MALIYTDNIGFNMRDWKLRRIKEVYAGLDCVMAITEKGEILQKLATKGFDKTQPKSTRPIFSERIDSSKSTWSLSGVDHSSRHYSPGKRPTDIRQIAISHAYSALAIGLTNCGTCCITRLPQVVREAWGAKDFDTIFHRVASWRDIVQVAVADSFFALDINGRVHCSPFCRYSETAYQEVYEWRNVRRIVTGNLAGIFGITYDGRVLATGLNHNKDNSPMMRELAQECDVTDIYATGSECEKIIIAKKDGTAHSVCSEDEPLSVLSEPHPGRTKILDGNFAYSVYCLSPKLQLQKYQDRGENVFKTPVLRRMKIKSFAVGEIGYNDPFVIAVVSMRRG